MLIIDSHNAEINEKKVFNLHLRNSLLLKEIFDADLITLPKHLIQNKKYKKVVFVHASKYTKSRHFIEYILKQDTPELWYVTNDYNLGEPNSLWSLCKKYNRKYNVIANHKPEHSKVVTGNGYIGEWHVCNLNSLCFKPLIPPKFNQVSFFFNVKDHDYRSDIVYFGAWRKGRKKYFRKYFDRDFPVSTSKKNVLKFTSKGINALWTNRLNWYGTKDTLFDYKNSLYIEDERTHLEYSHLANRYYEALSYSIPTFFDKSCLNTIEKAEIDIPEWFIVDSLEELRLKIESQEVEFPLSYTRNKAIQEKAETIKFIRDLLS